MHGTTADHGQATHPPGFSSSGTQPVSVPVPRGTGDIISGMIQDDQHLSIAPPESHEPWKRLQETMAACEGQAGFNLFAEWPQIEDYPGFRRDLVLLARRERHLIGGIILLAAQLRLGESRIRTALLLSPVVHPAFSGSGLGPMLMEHAWQTALRKGFQVVWSEGHPIFERKHGFIHFYPPREPVLLFRRSVLSPSAGRLLSRSLRLSDVPFLRSLHERNESRAWGSFLRTSGHYAFFWNVWKHCRIVSDLQGRMTGYYLPSTDSPDTLDILECGVTAPEYYSGLTGLIRRLAGDLERSTVRFFLAPWHPLARDQILTGIPHSVRSVPWPGGRAGCIALANLPDMLESMIPEWEHRLSFLPPGQTTAECTLVVEKEKNPWVIRAVHGAVSVSPGLGGNRLPLTRMELTGLLTGHYTGDEWIEQRATHLDNSGAELVRALFTGQTAYAWRMDRPEWFIRSQPDDHRQNTRGRAGNPDL